MNIDADEYNLRIKKYQEAFPEEHANLLIEIANTAMNIVKQRIQTSGINEEGKPYKGYSKNYLEYKKKEGKYKGFTDFSFTNRMWTNIQLVSDNTELFSGIARITARGSENIDKLRKNTVKFGQILALSKNEINDIKKDYENGLLDIHRKYGLL